MNNLNEFSRLIEAVRGKKPLVHHITNYVTVNDCANVTLAIGASPIMADAIEEAADIAAISSSLVINIGTLNERTIKSMIAAGESANRHGVPVVLDPVGAGASKLRNDTTEKLLSELKISVIRGNISEIRYISGLSSNTKGVDASESDCGGAGEITRELAKKLGCIVAATGASDAISDGLRTVYIKNGTPILSCITGAGCMCSSLVGSFAGAAPDELFAAASAAILCMGIAGDISAERNGTAGNGSFRSGVLDAIYNMDAATLEKRARLNEA